MMMGWWTYDSWNSGCGLPHCIGQHFHRASKTIYVIGCLSGYLHTMKPGLGSQQHSFGGLQKARRVDQCMRKMEQGIMFNLLWILWIHSANRGTPISGSLPHVASFVTHLELHWERWAVSEVNKCNKPVATGEATTVSRTCLWGPTQKFLICV